MLLLRDMQKLPMLACSIAAVLCTGALGHSIPTATIRNGTVKGVYNSEFNQDFFLGIPFAEAPRLAQAKPITEKFNGTFEATKYGDTCYGFGSNQALHFPQSEDCLNLNVIRPSGYTNEKLPVLVWIYGGGWRQGSSADPMWNLSYITNQSVYQNQPTLTVSLNYRLSFLGFAGGQEAADAGAANLGYKDQRVALQWIQENIAAFGGDPRRVTIWGESAGGASVASQLIAHGGKGGESLFRAGILISGFTTGTNPTFPNATQAMFDKMVAHTNCTNAANKIDCLRKVPIEAIYPFEDTLGTWEATIDGTFIEREPVRELADGRVARVPIIVGGNSDEGLFVTNALNYYSNTSAELQGLIQEFFPAINDSAAAEILAAYPQGAPAPPYSLPPDYPWCEAMNKAHLACSTMYRRQSAFFGDFFSGAARRHMAQGWAKLGLPTYSFRFDTNPTAIPIVYWVGLGPGFAEHGAELAYEFGLPPGFTTPIDYYPPIKPVASHVAVSKDFLNRWISFANDLTPNGCRPEGLPVWPDYRQGPQNYVFNATDHAVNTHIEHDNYREYAIGVVNKYIYELSYGTHS